MTSLCGPSNTLQNLQKHTSLDKTLQQDRIRSSSNSPAQGFRSSATGPSSANHEFEAFSGIPQDPYLLSLQHRIVPPVESSQLFPTWASDFQSLNLHSAPTTTTTQYQQTWTSPQSFSSPNWHAEFLKQTHKKSTAPTSHSPSHSFHTFTSPPLQQLQQQQQQQQFIPPPSSSQPYLGNPIYQQPIQPTQFSLPEHKHFTDAAFELAFQEASNWQTESLHDNQPHVASTTATTTTIHEEEEEKLVAKEKVRQRDDVEKDGDDLARTAGLLVESLSGNQDKKFQQSTFLALMRKLRDKEVKVEGDKMVEVES